MAQQYGGAHSSRPSNSDNVYSSFYPTNQAKILLQPKLIKIEYLLQTFFHFTDIPSASIQFWRQLFFCEKNKIKMRQSPSFTFETLWI